MSHKFKTTVMWHDSAGNECEAEVSVTYEHHYGFKGDRIDPPEDDSVEIIDIIEIHQTIAPGEPFNPLPADLMEDDALLAECMQHWTDDEIAGQESRAEQRAEMLREERD